MHAEPPTPPRGPTPDGSQQPPAGPPAQFDPPPPIPEFPELHTTPFREFAGTVLSHPAGWIASGFGAGFSPIASGTVGTAVALLPWLLLRELHWAAYIAVVVLAFAVGVWASERVIRALSVQDPGVIVWDEFVGLWIALFAAPQGWGWVLAGFLLFRLFDIWKPWPVGAVDARIHGGLGAMLDDALAGLYALAALQLLHLAYLHNPL